MGKKTATIEEVKEFSEEVANAVRCLASQLGEDSQELDDDSIKEIIDSPVTHLYFARLSDTQEIVGMVTLSVFRIPYRRRAWIDDIVVDQMHRNNGFGVQLLKYAMEMAKEKHAKILDLTSQPMRVSANKLYISLGFKMRETNVYRFDL
jgi:GNAT superfamily N-acetyltransferase